MQFPAFPFGFTGAQPGSVPLKIITRSAIVATALLSFSSAGVALSFTASNRHQTILRGGKPAAVFDATSRTFPPSSSRLRMAYEVTGDRMALPQGSYVALITPFLPCANPADDLDIQIDFDSLRSMVRWHTEQGTDALCILGTTSEASVMTMEERASIIDLVVEECKGKVPIIVGTGTIDPRRVISMTHQAEKLGADGVLVVTPYYVKPTPSGLLDHFRRIARCSALPVIMYNVPSRSGVDMSVETTAACAKIPGIAGIKDATGDVERVAKYRKAIADPGFLLLSGDDETGAKFTLQGGDGVISVTSNVVPGVQHAIMAAAVSGDGEAVKKLNSPLELLHGRLFIESNPIPCKWALRRTGVIAHDVCRPPLHSMSTQHEGAVEEALRGADLI